MGGEISAFATVFMEFINPRLVFQMLTVDFSKVFDLKVRLYAQSLGQSVRIVCISLRIILVWSSSLVIEAHR